MFEPIDLPYEFDALEPYIDSDTMQLHYSKHYVGYTNKLNTAIEGTDYVDASIEELLSDLESLPEEIRTPVRNNGGGYYNHTMFWQIMSEHGGGEPDGDLGDAIEEEFESFENFQAEFETAAKTQFGSGWAWLVVDEEGALSIMKTPNQDNPLSRGFTPILGLDVWEHAYYLHYQNRRPDYIEAWWNVVDWEKVAEMFDAATE